MIELGRRARACASSRRRTPVGFAGGRCIPLLPFRRPWPEEVLESQPGDAEVLGAQRVVVEHLVAPGTAGEATDVECYR